MIKSTSSLRKKIADAQDLLSVVRTMKAMAAASIGQYEHSVLALEDYYHAVELGLRACFRERQPVRAESIKRDSAETTRVSAIVFGSDQGLVGQFNDTIAAFAIKALSGKPTRPLVWAVGERVHARLADTGITPAGLFALPNSVQAVTPLVGRILLEREERHNLNSEVELYIFHNRPASGGLYTPVARRLLPLDAHWHQELVDIPWPTENLPEVMDTGTTTLRALIREYLFVSLFRACAESLASENASRLAAMQHSEKNIGELLENLNGSYHRLRQNDIDEELFDVVSGFEALLREDN
jgi:F-type H+-transporting ATPase subunit gamma